MAGSIDAGGAPSDQNKTFDGYKKKGRSDYVKTSLSLSRDSKRLLSILKADLRGRDLDAPESSILEVLLQNTSADVVARLHSKRKTS